MLINELQKRAAISAGLRKLAVQKTAGPLSRLGKRALTGAAVHPLVTGVGLLALAVAGHKARSTYASMNPDAHRVMLGMP